MGELFALADDFPLKRLQLRRLLLEQFARGELRLRASSAALSLVNGLSCNAPLYFSFKSIVYFLSGVEC
jgi:hypothetical protein